MRQSPTTFRLVFKSPATRVYQLDGSAPYFGVGGFQVTSGDRDSASIVCPRRATLVRRETWCHCWSAEIDGRATAIHSPDGLFLVTVPAGSHHITPSFVPPGINWAALGMVAVVARRLVPMARSASSFRVRR